MSGQDDLPRAKKQKIGDNADHAKATSEELNKASLSAATPGQNFDGPLDPDNSASAPAERAINVENSLEKLSQYLRSEKKFVKAASLMRQLIQTSLNKTNAELFIETLRPIQSDLHKVLQPSTRQTYIELFQTLIDKKDQIPEHLKATVDRFTLRAVTHNQLFTDDSYVFAKAAKRCREFVNELPRLNKPAVSEDEAQEHTTTEHEIEDNERDRERRAWRMDLLECLNTLQGCYLFPWAKSTVNQVFDVVKLKRNSFSEEERVSLDKLLNSLHSKRTAIVAEGKEKRKNMISTEDQHNKRMVVGRMFHPLLNKPGDL